MIQLHVLIICQINFTVSRDCNLTGVKPAGTGIINLLPAGNEPGRSILRADKSFLPAFNAAFNETAYTLGYIVILPGHNAEQIKRQNTKGNTCRSKPNSLRTKPDDSADEDSRQSSGSYSFFSFGSSFLIECSYARFHVGDLLGLLFLGLVELLEGIVKLADSL